ncbi:STAS domain-containing protein [Roseimaritima sediminicola]|uniref:STAS domain-containing protein n=1 Tax=Roseimaritima sediminicola TaxID=2662066 RepID=UPI00129838A4|nr:STAS domain-containing protein [Roseimaritima sediminicola]
MLDVKQQGTVWLLAANQPLTAESIETLNQRIEPCFAAAPPKMVLDLQQVPLLDSAALEWIWDVRRRCDACGGAFELAAPTTLCREILQATRMTDHFVVFDNVVSAAGSFAQ